MTVLTRPIPAGAQAPLGYPVPDALLPGKQSFPSRIPKQSLGTSRINLLTEYRTRLTADVVTGKLDVREAAARLPEVDPLAADDVPDALEPDAGADVDEESGALPEDAAA